MIGARQHTTTQIDSNSTNRIVSSVDDSMIWGEGVFVIMGYLPFNENNVSIFFVERCPYKKKSGVTLFSLILLFFSFYLVLSVFSRFLVPDILITTIGAESSQ
jgi:hypothetical protein